MKSYMAYSGSATDGEEATPGMGGRAGGPKAAGGRKLFTKKIPGAPGKLSLGKTSSNAQSLSKLRGKGAIA